MGRIVQQSLLGEEDNRVEPAPQRGLNKVERMEAVDIRMAKAGFGAAIGEAIGDRPDKAYGDKSRISNVKAGHGVAEYLARIYADRRARRRLALALLRDDVGVRVRLLVECELDD